MRRVAPGGEPRAAPPALLLPPTPEGFVELDKTSVLVTAGRCECQFSRIERALPVQHFEIVRRAALITIDGETDRLPQICDRVLLATPDLMKFLITD